MISLEVFHTSLRTIHCRKKEPSKGVNHLGQFSRQSYFDVIVLSSGDQGYIKRWFYHLFPIIGPSRGFRWNTEGITIGIDLSPKLSCSRLFIDSNDTLYGVDNTNAYVWKLSKNDTNAITVAGIYGTKGQSSFQLENPQDVYVDQYGDIYVVDTNNHRIQKFINGSMQGITILGNGAIDYANRFRLQYPRNFAFESTEKFMYVAVHGNQEVLGFFTNRTSPTVPSLFAGNGTSGNTVRQLNGPWGIYLLPSRKNILFITNSDGHSVMR
ncbi:unnamed protein product, partial [Adineta ricciae]